MFVEPEVACTSLREAYFFYIKPYCDRPCSVDLYWFDTELDIHLSHYSQN